MQHCATSSMGLGGKELYSLTSRLVNKYGKQNLMAKLGYSKEHAKKWPELLYGLVSGQLFCRNMKICINGEVGFPLVGDILFFNLHSDDDISKLQFAIAQIHATNMPVTPIKISVYRKRRHIQNMTVVYSNRDIWSAKRIYMTKFGQVTENESFCPIDAHGNHHHPWRQTKLN